MIWEGGESNGTNSETDLSTGEKGDGSKVQLMIHTDYHWPANESERWTEGRNAQVL